MRVLLVEPDTVTRQLIVDHLARWGYEAEAVASSAIARERLEGPTPPRLLLLACGLVDPSAVTLCGLLRNSESQPYTYTLLLPTRDQRRETVAAIDAGADDYLAKPFDWNDLEMRLRVARQSLSLRERLTTTLGQLTARAAQDAMTGVWDRDATLGFLSREAAASTRTGQPLAVVLVALEGMAVLNQQHGFEAGDRLLQLAAGRLRTGLRATDWVGRFSGTKFLLVLPTCNEARARHITDRLLRAIAAPPLPPELELGMPLRSGVATARGPVEPQELIAAARADLELGTSLAHSAALRESEKADTWIEPGIEPGESAAAPAAEADATA
jgi:diguanylate cyclase (GGDEF)-like protein